MSRWQRRLAAPLLLLMWMATAGAAGGAGAAGAPAGPSALPKKIVLIGGVGTEAPGLHAYASGIDQLAALLQAWSRGKQGQRLLVVRHPTGWPADSKALDGASALVLYSDGDTRHPLLNAAHRQQFDALMARGVGLVALHQASTVPADGAVDLARWLGAERRGLFDRTTETTTVQPAVPAHAVSRGVAAFTHRDEFYPTLQFAGRGVEPVLNATLHVQFRAGQPVVDDIPERHVVAWAYTRPGGGRSFGYTGAHALAALQQPMLRQTLLNAMLWTAGIALPAAGAAVPTDNLTHEVDALSAPVSQPMPDDVTTFHHDARRSGWQPRETVLTPAAVAAPGFGPRWQSPPFDSVDGAPPRLYASPLFVQRLAVTAGQHQGQRFAAVVAASSNGDCAPSTPRRPVTWRPAACCGARGWHRRAGCSPRRWTACPPACCPPRSSTWRASAST